MKSHLLKNSFSAVEGLAKLALPFLVLLLSFSKTVFAQEFRERRSEKVVIVPKWETIDKNFIIKSGERVEISGVVNGDVYAISGEVIVDGVVNGDLLAVAGGVDISGEVKQDVRVIGERISISGKVGKNLTIIGGKLQIQSQADLGGGILAIVESASISSYVPGDIEAITKDLTLTGKVAGNVEAFVDTLSLGPNSSVAKDLIYTSDKEALIDRKASVSGRILRRERPKLYWGQIFVFENLAKFFLRIRAFLITPGFLYNLLTGVLFIRFFPNLLRKGSESLRKKPWSSFAAGLLSFVLAPFVVLALFLSLIGIPLAFSILFLYLVTLVLAKIFVAFWIKQTFLSSILAKRRYLGYILALIGLYIFLFIPIIGDVISPFVIIFGSGAGILGLYEIYKKCVGEKVL